MTLTVGSCFAGIGGIDLGLEAAGGFRTVWHSEINRPALAVMAARFPNSQPLGDIEALAHGLFPPPPVDVLAGGPPCQGISAANAYGRKGLRDPRSRLFHVYAELIAQVRPMWVVMEQVTGLLTSGRSPGEDYRTVITTFEELGYAIGPVIVNSRTYVPQARARLIIVGNRDPRAVARAVLPLGEAGGGDPRAHRPPKGQHPQRASRRPGIYRKSRRPQTDTDAESWVEAEYANTLHRERRRHHESNGARGGHRGAGPHPHPRGVGAVPRIPPRMDRGCRIRRPPLGPPRQRGEPARRVGGRGRHPRRPGGMMRYLLTILIDTHTPNRLDDDVEDMAYMGCNEIGECRPEWLVDLIGFTTEGAQP